MGYSHSGWGLAVNEGKLPTDEVPRYDGIGANDFIMTGPLGACDFISTVDTPAHWELNMWYHMLNCGVTTRISGETDFPCIYGERVGLGRSYVKLPAGSPLDFDHWAEGIKAGRSYVSDGTSHLIDFNVGGLEVGQPGQGGQPSLLAAEKGKKLIVTAKVSAMRRKRRIRLLPSANSRTSRTGTSSGRGLKERGRCRWNWWSMARPWHGRRSRRTDGSTT